MADTFKLPAPIGADVPFGELHVWQWCRGEARNRIGVRNYLESLGFVMGRDKITPDDFEILQSAIDHFHRVAPHFPQPVKLSDALRPVADGAPGFYVVGMPGRYSLAPELCEALKGAGWIYDVIPETTYFEIVRGLLWAKYQTIIGSRALCEVKE